MVDSEGMETLYSLKDLEERINTEKGLMIYFSNESCNICKVLKPKVLELLKHEFPEMSAIYVDTELSPLISGQFRVFTIPTILIFFEGKEYYRFSRNISLHQLEDALEKPYSLIFGS